jgi:hypothetical protein
MRKALSIVAVMIMGLSAIGCFGALADLGRSSSSGVELGISVSILLMAAILWVLTDISAKLSRVNISTPATVASSQPLPQQHA